MIKNYIDKEHAEVTEKALKYLSLKYGEDFEAVSFIGQSLNFPGDRVGVKKTGSDNETFTVLAFIQNGNLCFRDSYYSIYIKNEYNNFIHKIISKYLKDFSLDVIIETVGANPEGLTPNTKIEEIHKKTDGDYIFYSKITITVSRIVQRKRFNKRMAQIASDIAKQKLLCFINFKERDNVILTYCISKDFFPVELTSSVRINAAIPVTTTAKTLSNAQLERLCNIVYLNNLPNNAELGNLGEIMIFMQHLGIADNIAGDELPCEMTRAEWNTVIEDIINDPMLAKLNIARYIDVNETSDIALSGHRAFCFTDNRQNAYIVFRGTAGDAEWYDNALGMLETETPYQKAAADFVKMVHDDSELNISYLVAAGHSKGGNKAQYAAVVLHEYVDKCFSIDGQGFSKGFFKKYASEIKKAQNKIITVAERRDFVNCLGFYLCKPTFFSGRRGNHTVSLPYGEALPFFHCPDALRTEEGKIGEISEYAYIPKTINDMVTYFFGNQKYADIWEQTAVSIVSLMTRKRKAAPEEVIKAAVNLVLVFIELVSQNKEFYEALINVIETESDVLTATAIMLSQMEMGDNLKSNAENNLVKLIVNDLAAAMQKNPVYIGYMLGASIKFIIQIIKASKDAAVNKTIYILICNFITETLKTIIEKQKIIILQPVYKRWVKLCDSLKNSDNITEAETGTLSEIVAQIMLKFL